MKTHHLSNREVKLAKQLLRQRANRIDSLHAEALHLMYCLRAKIDLDRSFKRLSEVVNESRRISAAPFRAMAIGGIEKWIDEEQEAMRVPSATAATSAKLVEAMQQ
jgi:hypothetical protein